MFSNCGCIYDCSARAGVTMNARNNGKLSKYVVRGSSQDYINNKLDEAQALLSKIVNNLKAGSKK